MSSPGLQKKLQFHLLKLADTKNEIARGNFISERFADLPNTHGKFTARGTHNALKIHKDALRSFRAQIELSGTVLVYALMSFKHEVEFADARKIMLATAGAGNLLFIDE